MPKKAGIMIVSLPRIPLGAGASETVDASTAASAGSLGGDAMTTGIEGAVATSSTASSIETANVNGPT